MTTLRLATEADIPELVEMGRRMHAESSFTPLEYTGEKVAATLAHGIRSAFVAVSLGDAGQITGCMQGDVINPWYSTDGMAVELFLYVRPEFRGTRAALMLLRAWMRWAIASGAKQLRPATAASSEAADRLYTAVGFRRVGTLYVMDAEDGNGRG